MMNVLKPLPKSPALVLAIFSLYLRQFCASSATAADSPKAASPAYNLFAPSNLVAWCIVPFDAKKRGPEARAAMLEKLGFNLFAYDYRAEHVPYL